MDLTVVAVENSAKNLVPRTASYLAYLVDSD